MWKFALYISFDVTNDGGSDGQFCHAGRYNYRWTKGGHRFCGKACHRTDPAGRTSFRLSNSRISASPWIGGFNRRSSPLEGSSFWMHPFSSNCSLKGRKYTFFFTPWINPISFPFSPLSLLVINKGYTQKTLVEERSERERSRFSLSLHLWWRERGKRLNQSSFKWRKTINV